MGEQQRRLVQAKIRRRTRLNSGQSLVEMALSITFLVLMFSGAVDLGRAYFVQVALNNAIGEAAHYASIFPPCAKSTYLNELALDSTDPSPAPKCTGSNSVLSRLLNESDNLDSARLSAVSMLGANCTGTVANDPPLTHIGDSATSKPDEFSLQVSYRLPLLTPIMRGMFGSDLVLYACNDQVARTSTNPSYSGVSLGEQVVPDATTPCVNSGTHFQLKVSVQPTSPYSSANGFALLKSDNYGTLLDTYYVGSSVSSGTVTFTTASYSAGSYYVILVSGTNNSGKVASPVQVSGTYRSGYFTCS